MKNSAFYMQWVLLFSALHSEDFHLLFFPGRNCVLRFVCLSLTVSVLDKVGSWAWMVLSSKNQKSGTFPSLSWKSQVQEHCHWSIGKAAARASPGQKRAFASLVSTLQSSAEEIASVNHQPRVPCLGPSRELRQHSEWQ